VQAADGWARVERSLSSISGIESPLNHPFFFFGFMPHPTVIAFNLILDTIFRGWHWRHPIGLILVDSSSLVSIGFSSIISESMCM
jgi:hypothetical protein